ncbi:uncharacterized protein LOC110990754 isoform X2 [Acanthaster planci]|uniref:Uncharacterized protein LOC110990754 isoform X2 n=1 Tax=Acanthaster planci TaxID=133434 RepID=A0A8B8A3N4_ACAPL|nr:uncharacterized protein LOC110990754 isoform X2 [Acanthaster planci]
MPRNRKKRPIEAHATLAKMAGSNNDFATLLAVYRRYADSESPSSWCQRNYIHLRAVKTASSIHKQLENILNRQLKAKYEWIKELLPRLHQLDVYALSGCLAPKISDETDIVEAEFSDRTAIEQPKSEKSGETRVQISKRNSEDSVAEDEEIASLEQ